MNEQDCLKLISKYEIENGFFDISINQIKAYIFFRRDIRVAYLKKHGIDSMHLKYKRNYKALIKSTLTSLSSLLKLLLSSKRINNVYAAYPRVDKVNGIYLDKFTDPVINLIEEPGNYVIFDHGMAGVHPMPRLHRESIIYVDFIYVLSELVSVVFWPFFYIINKHSVDTLYEKIKDLLNDGFSKKIICKKTLQHLFLISFFKFLFNKLQVKNVFGPARDYQMVYFFAAHSIGIKTFEFQHGITYGESILYSGYRDLALVPDYFLAFGENNPDTVYGIDPSKIINIGYAFNNYLRNISSDLTISKNDVLVISDPEVTDSMLSATLKLSEYYPQCNFYVRPHPHEIISDVWTQKLSKVRNIFIQDKRINIMVALQSFDNVIGENSTVLYEALSLNRKVGKLYFDGLNPLFLKEEDKDSFWHIRTPENLNCLLQGNSEEKPHKSIYSEFNLELLRQIIK